MDKNSTVTHISYETNSSYKSISSASEHRKIQTHKPNFDTLTESDPHFKYKMRPKTYQNSPQSTSFQKFQGGMPQHSGALRTPPYSPLLQNPVRHPGDCYVHYSNPHTHMHIYEDGGWWCTAELTVIAG